MLYVNNIVVAGCVTKDPQLNATQSGMSYTAFTVAVNQKVKNGEDKTTFIEVSCFGKTAEFFCRHAGKGCNVFVEGRLDISSYTDKNGQPKKSCKVIADNIQMITWKEKDSAADGAPATENYQRHPSLDQNNSIHKYDRSFNPNYQSAQPTEQQSDYDAGEDLPPVLIAYCLMVTGFSCSFHIPVIGRVTCQPCGFTNFPHRHLKRSSHARANVAHGCRCVDFLKRSACRHFFCFKIKKDPTFQPGQYVGQYVAVF